MKLEDAIEVVLSLARDNILDEKEANQDSEILIPERIRQIEACNVVEDFFVNKVFS